MKRNEITSAIALAFFLLPRVALCSNYDIVHKTFDSAASGTINFTNSIFDGDDVGNALYSGMEGYFQLAANGYSGFTVGWAESDVPIVTGGIGYDTDVTLIPTDFAAKFAVMVPASFVMDFKGGLTYNVFEEGNGLKLSNDEWLYGGQLSIDINYMLNGFFVGVKGRYQFIGDIDNGDHDYANWRLDDRLDSEF